MDSCLVDINNPVIKKTPTTRDLEFVTHIKMSMMGILERFSIFVGFVVGAGTWCPRLNLRGWDLSILASVELHSPPFGQFTSWSCDLQLAMGHSWPWPVWPMSPTPLSDELNALIHFWWRALECLESTAYLIHFTGLILVKGTWVLECRTRLFHSLHIWIFLIDQLRTFGSFTFATAHSTSITPRAFRKIPASFGKSPELI